MKKIMVLGVSAGVGKSTFARQLGRKLSVNVCHLDQLFWEPNWVMTSEEKFTRAQKEFIESNDKWIIEGNYSGTYDLRAREADTIIYLELPLIVCLYRVVKRWIKTKGRTRIDMAEGCPEKIDWTFIKFILTTYNRRKKKMRIRLEKFKAEHHTHRIYLLKGKKEIRSFLQKT